MSDELREDRTPLPGKPWLVRLTCCGRADGVYAALTWEEADRFRLSYTAPGHYEDVSGLGGGHRRSAVIEDGYAPALAARPDSPTLDVALDRALAVPHRDDDQPCSCDECMAYGAEDSGADWYRIPPANRVAIRILDGADDRLAAIAKAFRDHDEDVSPTLDVERRLREMRYHPTLSGRSGDFRSGWDAATVALLDALAAEAPERPAPRCPNCEGSVTPRNARPTRSFSATRLP